MPAPEASARGQGRAAGCRHHQLREALHVLGGELGRPSKSSPGSAVLRALTHIPLPRLVGPPRTEPTSLREKLSVLQGPSLSTYCVSAGSRHQQAVGAVGANQAHPAPHTVNEMTVPKTSACSCDALQQRVPGVGPRPRVSGEGARPDRLLRGLGSRGLMRDGCPDQPEGGSQAQCPDTDTTCPVSRHFPGGSGSLTPCFRSCTEEVLGDRGCHGDNARQAAVGAGLRWDLCVTHPHTSHLPKSFCHHRAGPSRPGHKTLRPALHPNSFPPPRGVACAPLLGRPSLLDPSLPGPGALSRLLPRFSPVCPERTGTTSWHSRTSPGWVPALRAKGTLTFSHQRRLRGSAGPGPGTRRQARQTGPCFRPFTARWVPTGNNGAGGNFRPRPAL